MIAAVLVMAGIAVLVVALLACALTLSDREHTRKVRRRDYQSAIGSLNDIDTIVNACYPTADLLGQAMCDEIRTVIAQHRKDTTCR